MLGNATILEVRSLLAQGQLTQRQIAKQVGISRGSVVNIAQGRCNLGDESPKRYKSYVLPADRPGAVAVRCPGCGAKIYRDDLGQCTLCTVREAIARKGKHTNVEIPSVREVEGALFGLTYAAGAVIDNVEAIDAMDTRYRLATDAEIAKHERRDAARAKARGVNLRVTVPGEIEPEPVAVDPMAEVASRLIASDCRDEDHIVYVSGAEIRTVRELIAKVETDQLESNWASLVSGNY